MTAEDVTIKLNTLDRISEAIALLAMILSVALPLYFYEALPSVIPRHFNFDGAVDGLGAKKLIWIGPIIGVVFYFGLSWISKRPRYLNYPVRITARNKRYQYRLAVRVVRLLKALVLCLIAYITYAIIQIGLGNMDGLHTFFIVGFFVAIFGTIGVFFNRSFKGQ